MKKYFTLALDSSTLNKKMTKNTNSTTAVINCVFKNKLFSHCNRLRKYNVYASFGQTLINLIFNFETILQFLNRSSYPPFFLWFKFNHLFLPCQMLQSALGLHFTDAFFPLQRSKIKKDSRKNMNWLKKIQTILLLILNAE